MTALIMPPGVSGSSPPLPTTTAVPFHPVL